MEVMPMLKVGEGERTVWQKYSTDLKEVRARCVKHLFFSLRYVAAQYCRSRFKSKRTITAA